MQEIKKRCWFEKFDYFSISGNDAKKFLNGITTGNIFNSKSKFCKTCWLNPNGVLKALLEIIFFDNKLEVIILEGNKDEVINYFNKIIFPLDDVSLSKSFNKIRFQEVNDINSWRIYQPIFFKNEDKDYEIYKKNLNLLNYDELQFWKINQAIPCLGNEIDGKNNPLELGLQDLIDFNKGCFLGQETMSKIKNVSSLKQEIRVWKSSNSILNLGAKNKNLYINCSKEKSVGKITRFHQLDSQIEGLAMIKRKYLEISDTLYSEIFGEVVIKKSVGSVFL